jgi:hypothetical protein
MIMNYLFIQNAIKTFLVKFKFQAWKPKDTCHKRGADSKHHGYDSRKARIAEQWSDE